MTDVNSVVLVGRLVRDAEYAYTAGGTANARFALAVSRSKKVDGEWKDEVSFIDIVYYGKSAESMRERLIKGRQVAVEGALRQSRWEKDGQVKTKVEVVAEKVQIPSMSEIERGF